MPQSADIPVAPINPNSHNDNSVKPTEKPRKWFWFWAALVIVGACGVAYAAYQINNSLTSAIQSAVSSSPSPSTLSSASPNPTTTPIADVGVTWLTNAQQLNDLALFTGGDTGDWTVSQTTYYKVGSDNGRAIILAVATPNAPSGKAYITLVQDSSSNYRLISSVSPSVFNNGQYTGPTLVTGIIIDNATKYASLTIPQTISLNNVNLRDIMTGTLFTGYSNVTVTSTASTPYGSLYNVTKVDTEGFTSQYYILKRVNGTTEIYNYTPSILGSDSVPAVTWSDGTKNSAPYRIDGGGSCGSASAVAILTSGTTDGLTQIGTASDGTPVYGFSDTSNAVFQSFLKASVYPSSDPKAGQPMTAADYTSQHGIFIYKDALSRMVIFASSNLFGAECGKPVVYLYPTKPTQVKVSLDVKVTKSDPTYDNGWIVNALPDGTLKTLAGKIYDSLYWEGTGQTYPMIDSGFVVAKADLQSTLSTQLKELGLNAKESSAFMDFWLPKLQASPDPYLRLTWFGTKQMNILAPMTVTPTPDTVIRVFLDWQGLAKPISIAPEHLSSIPRIGFTVVEWGGLLKK